MLFTPALKEFFKAHWRKFAVLGTVGAAFVLGRGLAPIKEVTKIETRTVDLSASKEKSLRDEFAAKLETERQARIKAENSVRTITRVVVTKPDGTRIERERDHSEAASKESVATERESKETVTIRTDETREAVAVKVEEKKVEILKESKRQHHFSLMVGYDTRPAWLSPLDAKGFTVGLSYQHRLFNSPFFAGAWILHTGAVGASLGFEL